MLQFIQPPVPTKIWVSLHKADVSVIVFWNKLILKVSDDTTLRIAGFILCPLSDILPPRQHNVSKIGSLSICRWRGNPYMLYHNSCCKFSCYLPQIKPGPRYLYSCSYVDMVCPVIDSEWVSPLTWGRKQFQFLKTCVILFLEYWKMDKFKKPKNLECSN
jgi:hypothetical protein